MKTKVAIAALTLLGVAHCSKERSEEKALPISSASVLEAASTASAAAPNAGRRATDAVRSVYPLDAGPPDPLVHDLCSALHDLPEQRRAACCEQASGIVMTGECERMLTSAVGSKAAALDATEVDRCVVAMRNAHEGCDWVGPFPPDMPAECRDVVHGSLEAGAVCRSSLECVKGLRCHGVGPTAAGVCGSAHADGQACGAAVDSLAVFLKEQGHLEGAHPQCTGYCDRLRCAPLLATGEACRTGTQCADGACAAGKCAPRASGKPGEACPTGECAGDARCIAGKCVERRPAGSPCGNDFECRGACIKSDAGRGTCGRGCSAR